MDQALDLHVDAPRRHALIPRLAALMVAAGLLAGCVVNETRPLAKLDAVQAKEQIIKAALYGLLQDTAEVERLFEVLVAQPEY